MSFLKRELIGGLILIVALATFAGGDFRMTRPVVILFALGVLWIAAVAVHAIRHRGTADASPIEQALEEWLPSGSFVIGGPGAKVGKASISGSYSNDPKGFGGIYGAEIEDASMENNIHDVPEDQDAPEDEDGAGPTGRD